MSRERAALHSRDRHCAREGEWERGCTGAGILMVLMFAVLSFGSVMWGW